eukprot:comp22481_c0_seq1/m.33895 comp22481_c0_seq1/g.33895  ORF comp22481_c0_seq1/g.33895 comp22481_c0_seq1/m.33895 type:complete len:618 (-) comp22481_c0_seq1:1123-2976(-)
MSKPFLAALHILVLEGVERLNYYTIVNVQRNNLERQFLYPTSTAVSLTNVQTALAYTTVFLGAYFGDSLFGRYKSLISFFIVYLVGIALVCTAVYPEIKSEALYLFAMTTFIAVGAGASKPMISTFGGDQFDPSNPQEKKSQKRFFAYYFLMISLGGTISFACLTTLAVGGSAALPGNKGSTFIPREYGFFSAYTITGGFTLLAFLFFLAGTPRYRHAVPDGNSVKGMFYYTYKGVFTNSRGKSVFAGAALFTFFVIFTIVLAFTPEGTFQLVGSVFAILTLFAGTGCMVYGCLDTRWVNSIGDIANNCLTVAEARQVFSTMPIILVANLSFTLLQESFTGPFVVQACHMDLRIGGGQLNATFLYAIITLTVGVFTPLLHEIVWPAWGRLRGRPVCVWDKLLVAFITGISSLAIAVAMEYARRAHPLLPMAKENISLCAGNKLDPVVMTDMSIWWMLFAIVPLGISLTCFYPTLLAFAYEENPPRARNFAQAFNLFSASGLPNILAACLTHVLRKYLPNNLDKGKGHVEYFHYVAIGVMLVGMPLSWYICRQFFTVGRDRNRMEDHLKAMESGSNVGSPSERTANGTSEGTVVVEDGSSFGTRAQGGVEMSKKGSDM